MLLWLSPRSPCTVPSAQHTLIFWAFLIPLNETSSSCEPPNVSVWLYVVCHITLYVAVTLGDRFLRATPWGPGLCLIDPSFPPLCSHVFPQRLGSHTEHFASDEPSMRPLHEAFGKPDCACRLLSACTIWIQSVLKAKTATLSQQEPDELQIIAEQQLL